MALPAILRPTPATIAADIGVTLDGWTAGTHQADVGDTAGVEWWIVEDGLDGWANSPDVRLTGTDRVQDHGQFDGPSFFATRVVTIKGVAICPDKATAVQAQRIVASLATWDPSQLYLLQVTEPGTTPSTLRTWVRLNTATKVGGFTGTAFEWQMQVKAPDPRRYDDTATVLTLYPPTGATGGVTLPAAVPWTLSTAGVSTSSATAVNAGTVATRPVVVLNGPLVDPQIANVTAGKSLALTITLASDDVLTLDFDRRTVLLNGSASRSSVLTSSAAWWELAPGGNDLAFTAGGGAGSATVTYRSAWL